MVCYTVMVLISALFMLIRTLIVSRTALTAENLALRQQLTVLNRKIHRPQLHRRDRFFWVILSQLWKNWREVLIIVKPETVIKWHRHGFRLYWRWKSKAPVGRPKIDKEIRELIGKMSRENPLRGVPRLSRPHEALERNSPTPQEIEAPAKGKVIAIPQVGGLHHRYR